MTLTPGIAASLTKYLGDEPVPPTPPPYVLPGDGIFASANFKYWFVAERDACSDLAGTTPCNNNDTVAFWGNQGTLEDAIQTTSGNRPVFKTGGLNGRPYLQCSGSQWFEDLVGLTQPGSIASFTNHTYFVVTDDVDSAGDRSIFAGAGLTRGGKSGFKLYQSGGVDSIQHCKQNHIHAVADLSGPRSLSLPNIIGTTKPVNATYFAHKFNDAAWNEHTHGSNETPSNAVTNTSFLTGTGAESGPFVGRVYEVIGFHGGDVSEADMERLFRYLNGKYQIYRYTPVVVRDTSIVSASTNSLSIPLPPDSQEGDQCVILLSAQVYVPSTPSGWTSMATQSANGTHCRAVTKVLDAADILAGSVTSTLATSSNLHFIAAATTFIGPVNWHAQAWNSGSSSGNSVASRTRTSSWPYAPGDKILAFCVRLAGSYNGACGVTGFDLLENYQVTNRCGGLFIADYVDAANYPIVEYTYGGTVGGADAQHMVLIRGMLIE